MLAFLPILASCRGTMPVGPVCQVASIEDGAYCAVTDKPDDVTFRRVADMDQFICRPLWYEQQIIEWMKRELEGQH